jgi:hypothetical protein
VLKDTPALLKNGSLNTFSSYLVNMLTITKCPPKSPYKLPSLVTKAILEESEQLKVAESILVAAGYWLNWEMKVSCFEIMAPSLAFAKIKY